MPSIGAFVVVDTWVDTAAALGMRKEGLAAEARGREGAHVYVCVLIHHRSLVWWESREGRGVTAPKTNVQFGNHRSTGNRKSITDGLMFSILFL